MTTSEAAVNPASGIESEIERAREAMKRMANLLGFVHPDVLRCSEYLDRLLLEYYEAARCGTRG